MKIGIVLTAYNSDDYISQVLRPWLELRKKYNILISCNSGMFKDCYDLGFTNKNKNTLDILINSDLDFLVTTNGNNSLDEDYSRNVCLSFLKKNNCDIIWVLDGDEEYSILDIENIIRYISEFPNYIAYSIEFKNYTIRLSYFFKGFKKPVIYRNNFNGGVSHFTFDTYIQYNDGTHVNNDSVWHQIPKNISHIRHFSWLETDSRTFEKIEYQNIRYAGEENSRCAWKNNDGKLSFNHKFFKDRNLELPILFKEGNKISYDFELKYSRNENRLYIEWVNRNMDIEVVVCNSDNLNQKYVYEISCVKNIIYFIDCPVFVEQNLKSITVQVLEKNELIHSEELILSFEN